MPSHAGSKSGDCAGGFHRNGLGKPVRVCVPVCRKARQGLEGNVVGEFFYIEKRIAGRAAVRYILVVGAAEKVKSCKCGES